jgi:hypothetical protein
MHLIVACDEEFYGHNCSGVCGHCANNATCDHVTGSCPSAVCEPGWQQTTDQKCDTGLCSMFTYLIFLNQAPHF